VTYYSCSDFLTSGVCDPFNTLQPNQIFIQLSKTPNSEKKVISGKVLIYRNPCLHPGDVRIVNAVENPLLKEYENVVIFPTCGPSIPAACSGGT
jgi:RNA-dependent RNA polymerase